MDRRRDEWCPVTEVELIRLNLFATLDTAMQDGPKGGPPRSPQRTPRGHRDHETHNGGTPMARAVGIDLGTTNSVVAVLEGGEPTVIANAEGDRKSTRLNSSHSCASRMPTSSCTTNNQ